MHRYLFWKTLSGGDLIYDLSILFAFPSLQVGKEKRLKKFGLCYFLFLFFTIHHNSSFNRWSSFHTLSLWTVSLAKRKHQSYLIKNMENRKYELIGKSACHASVCHMRLTPSRAKDVRSKHWGYRGGILTFNAQFLHQYVSSAMYLHQNGN